MVLFSLLFHFFFLLQCYQRAAATVLFDNTPHDPDEKRNVSELITSKGYPLEEHTVQTEDGYLLSVQRIPHGKRTLRRNQNGVVLLIHGFEGDASNWVLNFPHQSLGFLLPDAGYDTWFVNTRGCIYSRKHVIYTTDQKQFWDFSFDEVGLYDVPATIDYILDATGEKQLFVIAFSQGTTGTFVMLSQLPEYNDKVKLFIALAPITTDSYATTIARAVVPVTDEFLFVVNSITGGDFLPNDGVSKFFKELLCDSFAKGICEAFLFAVGGLDRTQLNETRLGVYFSKLPSGTSAKTVAHYAQLVKSKDFRRFDYGRNNLEYYQQEEPPEYDLSGITAPVALFWSTYDKVGDPTDVDILRGKLNSLVFDYRVPDPYGHFDFILALNAHEMIHQPVLRLLPQYET